MHNEQRLTISREQPSNLFLGIDQGQIQAERLSAAFPIVTNREAGRLCNTLRNRSAQNQQVRRDGCAMCISVEASKNAPRTNFSAVCASLKV